MTPHVTDRLSAWLDDELDPIGRRAVDEHLAACAECRALLDDLRSIVAAAADYPGRAPERDLWAGIARGIREAPVIPLAPRRAGFGWRALLAASVVMAAVGAGATWLALRPAPGGAPAVPVVPATALGVRNAALAEEQYDRAVQDLEAVLAAGRSRLDTATVRTIEQSLARIDAAIAEARAAIQRDSSNVYLNRQITANMRRKLNLLRVATRAIAATS